MRLKKEEKIISVQYLRGLAALGVVFCHYGSDLRLYPKLSLFFNFGQTGVFVFFLISGFIIVYSLNKSGYKAGQFLKFLLKRSIRIDPAYICVILLTIIFFTCLSISKNEPPLFSPGQFLAHVFYIVPFTNYKFYNHVFWTLSVEFQFYCVIGLVYFLFNNRIYKSFFLIAFSLTCFIPFSNSAYIVTNYAPVFAFGISLIPLRLKQEWRDMILPVLILVLIAYKFNWPILLLLTGSGLAVLFFNINFKPLMFLGNISYSLYLTHGLVLMLLKGIGKRMNADFNAYQLIWLLIETGIAIGFAYLFYLLVEKPSIRLSKRVFYKK